MYSGGGPAARKAVSSGGGAQASGGAAGVVAAACFRKASAWSGVIGEEGASALLMGFTSAATSMRQKRREGCSGDL